MYVTDIFGNGIWRFTPGGAAQLWTSAATNPLLVDPDGVKVYHNAVFTSIGSGQKQRIPSTQVQRREQRPLGRDTSPASSSTTW